MSYNQKISLIMISLTFLSCSFFFPPLIFLGFPWPKQRVMPSGCCLLISKLGPEIAWRIINSWQINFHSIRTEMTGSIEPHNLSFHFVHQIWGTAAGNLQFLFLSCLKYLGYFLFIRSTWELSGKLRNHSYAQNQRFQLWMED